VLHRQDWWTGEVWRTALLLKRTRRDLSITALGLWRGTAAVFEAKFMLPWSFSEEAAAEKYMAQLQHNM
jgi:hypothetical protein